MSCVEKSGGQATRWARCHKRSLPFFPISRRVMSRNAISGSCPERGRRSIDLPQLGEGGVHHGTRVAEAGHESRVLGGPAAEEDPAPAVEERIVLHQID